MKETGRGTANANTRQPSVLPEEREDADRGHGHSIGTKRARAERDEANAAIASRLPLTIVPPALRADPQLYVRRYSIVAEPSERLDVSDGRRFHQHQPQRGRWFIEAVLKTEGRSDLRDNGTPGLFR